MRPPVSEPAQGLRVTWVKSAIGYSDDQKRTIAALGLKRLHQTVEHRDSPSVRGMVKAVRHLVVVEELPAGQAPVPRRAARSWRR
jgi:large subunit ribosomal protein L30